MAIILGLDVSTSCTGVCVLDSEAPAGQVLLLDRIEFKKCKTLFDKIDVVKEYLRDNLARFQVERIVIEEALMGFRPGLSSAQTISTLLRFNGMVSNVARETLSSGSYTSGSWSDSNWSGGHPNVGHWMPGGGHFIPEGQLIFTKIIEPEYISASHARKVCGIKLQRTSVAGMSQKEQTTAHMLARDLQSIVWPLNKVGKRPSWVPDAIDAYVIARAAAITSTLTTPPKSNLVPTT